MTLITSSAAINQTKIKTGSGSRFPVRSIHPRMPLLPLGSVAVAVIAYIMSQTGYSTSE